MAAPPLPSLSASVTRILSLTGFPPELKTKDIQAAFSEWDGVGGGFKIKWLDDTSLLLVFSDAGIAKRAYLQTLLNPHPSLVSPTSALALQIKPYDGPDAQAIIYTVNNRRGGPNNRQSISIPNNAAPAHLRGPSGDAHRRNESTAGGKPSTWKGNGSGNSPPSVQNSLESPNGRGPSPTLPSIPSHPTLNSLINSSLAADPNAVATSSSPPTPSGLPAIDPSPPKVGDPARRMVGAALGVKHPGVTPKAPKVDESLHKAMGGMVIAE